MQIKSLFVGAAGIAAITALSGCSTGSVKGELKVPYAVSTTFTSFGNGEILNSLQPTELDVEVNAKVVTSLQNSGGAPNATGTFEIEDENLDLDFEGKILYGIIESDQTLNVTSGSVSSQVNTALGANIVPAFEGAFGNSGNGTIRGAAFLGTLGGDDDDSDDQNANGTFIAVVLDFPTIDLSQLPLGINKPVTKLVGFAAINADVLNLNNAPAGPAPALEGYVAAGFATKGKLKWNIVPGTPAP